MKKNIFKDFKTLHGTIKIPADKSISHRAAILASLANGKSTIKNFSSGQDPNSTLNVLKNLGIEIDKDFKTSTLKINSNGKFKPGNVILDCGNSGTTMRLMSGILAGQNFDSTLIGDESLSKRPMGRIIEPLRLMGAQIESNSNKAPIKIHGSKLEAINYSSKIASAQVKSCILLAGLFVNEGTTTYTEPYLSRNHTELMLQYMGANIKINGLTTTIKKSELNPIEVEIFGDISSAAYFIVAGLITPNSEITLHNIGLNPTRTGIIDIVKKMGGNIEIYNEHTICSEPVGDIKVSYTENLKCCNISGDIIPKLIDEIPVIAVLATQAEGTTVISNASDLRNKESDRIFTIVKELKKIGANIEETPDGMIIHGKTQLCGDNMVETYCDHRLAMSLYVAGLVCKKEICINGFEWVDISFPEFSQIFEQLKH